jgi:hypothetical protein
LKIEPSSWAAGRRTVECTAAHYDPSGHVIAVSGSVRTTAR